MKYNLLLKCSLAGMLFFITAMFMLTALQSWRIGDFIVACFCVASGAVALSAALYSFSRLLS